MNKKFEFDIKDSVYILIVGPIRIQDISETRGVEIKRVKVRSIEFDSVDIWYNFSDGNRRKELSTCKDLSVCKKMAYELLEKLNNGNKKILEEWEENNLK